MKLSELMGSMERLKDVQQEILSYESWLGHIERGSQIGKPFLQPGMSVGPVTPSLPISKELALTLIRAKLIALRHEEAELESMPGKDAGGELPNKVLDGASGKLILEP